jgi:hypothetical protein
MQAKTMKSVMRKKIDAWAETVTDPVVKQIIKDNTIITGGAIASMLMQEPVNDYDVYFRNGESAFAVAEYYVKKFIADGKNNVPLFLCDKDGRPITKFDGGRFRIMAKSAGVVTDSDSEPQAEYQYFEATDPDGEKSEEYVEGAVNAAAESGKSKGEYKAVWMSSNAITLSDKIQVVIRFFGEPEEIHKNYDFVHCTSYWQSWDGFLFLNPAAMESILSKVLQYQGSLYPICSVIRTRKFIGRGWRISAGQYLKMCMQISELDMNDIKVLEDQLTGVDAAFFMELISCLKKDMHEKQTKDIDKTYLMQLIDKIF